jgi:hypothetical protein
VEAGRRVIRVNRFAVDALERAVTEHSISCGWQKRGRYHVAVTEEVAQKSLKPYARNLDAWQESHEYLDRDALRQRIGSDYYAAAGLHAGTRLMIQRRWCVVWPTACRPRCSCSRTRRSSRRSSKARLPCPHGPGQHPCAQGHSGRQCVLAVIRRLPGAPGTDSAVRQPHSPAQRCPDRPAGNRMPPGV